MQMSQVVLQSCTFRKGGLLQFEIGRSIPHDCDQLPNTSDNNDGKVRQSVRRINTKRPQFACISFFMSYIGLHPFVQPEVSEATPGLCLTGGN